MKRALVLIFLIFIAVIGSVVTRLNNESVSFHYYFGSIEIGLSLLLLAVLATGALFGLLLTFGLSLSAHARMRRLQRTLRLREQEIRNLRDIPIKGRH